MPTYKLGSEGPEVKRLQEALAAKGFRPGVADGHYGEGTEAAVAAFQKSEGLVADGVAGPLTQERLALVPAGQKRPSVTALVTLEMVSKMFPGTPVANIRTNLPAVLAALDEFGLGDRPMVLMALSTIRAETASFMPVKEGVSKYNTSPGGKPFDLYDSRRDLGNRGAPDGSDFAGSGYVQLTGRDNFLRHGTNIGLGDELVRNPAKSREPVTAARLLASFLKSVEMKTRAALANGDLASARRYVNGGSHGLDNFTSAYRVGDAVLPTA